MAKSGLPDFNDEHQWRTGSWTTAQGAYRFRCGYCDSSISSTEGLNFNVPGKGFCGVVRVCPECRRATFLTARTQTPGEAPGHAVPDVPPDIEGLYMEARRAIAADAPTAAVLTLRKILMHVAVERGAKAGEKFIAYVEHLATENYIPPNGKQWVDHIRTKGNEANHEIVIMSDDEARRLLRFVELLLRNVYEYPALVPPTAAP